MPFNPIEYFVYLTIRSFTKHDAKLRIYLLEINCLHTIIHEYSTNEQYIGKSYAESPWIWPIYTRLEKLIFKASKRSNYKTKDEATRENITNHLCSVFNSAKFYYEKYHNDRLMDEEDSNSEDEYEDDEMALSP